MLASDVIYRALRKCGHLRPGYTCSPEMYIDALNEWSALYDELNSEQPMQFTNPVYQFNVTGPGSQTNGNGYSIGPSGADWTAPRPESIIRANLVMTTLGTQPVYIPLRPLTQKEWASLAIQQIPPVNVTSMFWYDPQYPNGVFNVFPPLNGNAIQIYEQGALAPPVVFATQANYVAALALAYAAPPGYWNVTVYGIAEKMYHMVTRDVMPHKVPYQLLAAWAKTARDHVKNINRAIPRLGTDAPRGGAGGIPTYDQFVWETGEPE